MQHQPQGDLKWVAINTHIRPDPRVSLRDLHSGLGLTLVLIPDLVLPSWLVSSMCHLLGNTRGPQLMPTSSLCVQSDVNPHPGCLHDEIWMLPVPQSRPRRSILPVPGPYDVTAMSLPLRKI